MLNDPPWGATAAAWDKPLDWPAWWAAIDHALATNGVACIFASLRLALTIAPLATRPFAYDLVWSKNRKSGHLNANKAPMRAHELVLVFGAAMERYVPQFTEGHEPMHAATRRSKSELYGHETLTSAKAGTTRRYASSVLPFASVSNDSAIRFNSTQKPVPLLRWLVRAYARPGELVVDPTCGSGSAIRAARAEGCSALGWDTRVEQVEKGRRWLAGTESPLFAGVGT